MIPGVAAPIFPQSDLEGDLELLKNRDFDFALFSGGGGGVTVILDLIFLEGRVTKILNFALKINGVVGRVAHARSSDPAPQKNLECALGALDAIL